MRPTIIGSHGSVGEAGPATAAATYGATASWATCERSARSLRIRSGTDAFEGTAIPPRVTSSRSPSSMTCCVPTLRDGSFPALIHRRIVSGLRPTRRAASGTVSATALLSLR